MNKSQLPAKEINQLPLWTWIVPLLVFQLGSQFSALFKYAPGAAFYYLPTSIGIILINWWGPKRVIPALYINAIVSAHLWDVGPWYLWPLYALPETIFVFLSWYFFSFRKNGKYWFPDINSVVIFLILGILIPLLVEIFMLELIYLSTGERQLDRFFFTFVRSSLGEFISNFGLTLPILYYLTWPMQKKSLLLYTPELPTIALWPKKKYRAEIAAIYGLLFLLSIVIPFHQYWFVFGIFSLTMAIRHGFGMAVITNTYLFLITYLLPLAFNQFFSIEQSLEEDVINIYLGTSLLYVFSAITGRIISDLKSVKKRLGKELYKAEVTNKELATTNEELDRFAYSVSHDLSAPLKSILGLTNISKLSDKLLDHRLYFEKIELSVKKLDTFIHEVLDYSSNKRQQLVIELVNLQDLCKEIFENLKYIDGFEKVLVDMDALAGKELYTDKARLKIIIHNVLTNAIKFQKQLTDHQPNIRLSCEFQSNQLRLLIEDNGEGIPTEIQKDIFGMFYRGNLKSKGSGLGLYIARESAKKIKSTISFASVYGKGTVFMIDLCNLS